MHYYSHICFYCYFPLSLFYNKQNQHPMSLLRITNGLERLSDQNLRVKISAVIVSMTDNANFPSPQPSLATVQAALDAFANALAEATSGSSYQKAVKNDLRQELIKLAHSLSNYVLFASDGDAIKALSSGFDIAKEYGSSEPITKPMGLKLQDGPNAGELVFKFAKVKGARSYVYQYTQDPLTEQTMWMQQTGTTGKVVLKKLNSCKRYWCRVVAIGPKGQEAWSDAVSRVVQ
jgi:hypothetical protein